MTEITIDTDKTHGRDLVLTLHPIDGPHDHWSTSTLADEMAEYMRTLVHVTLPERFRQSLPYPSTVDAVVSDLSGLVTMATQLVTQLADRLESFAGDPSMSDDEGGDPLARCVRGQGSLDDARIALGIAAKALQAARSQTTHLSYRLPEGDE